MERALELAEAARGTTAPNPPVGAVIVREGKVLGEGHTQPVGGAHAEQEAIHQCAAKGVSVVGATMYVTLEPCCHFGHTAPCTNAILEAGIEKVVVGVVDPFPAVMGRGISQLRSAGVDVLVGVCESRSLRVVRGFHRSCTHGLPEVTAKVAVSLDGRIATSTGESQWITGEDARQHGHRLRASHDAILVGIGTVLADNPRLTCRLVNGHDPVPIVLDSQLRIPESSRLFHGNRRALVFCADDAVERQLPADIVVVGKSQSGVGLSIPEVLRELSRRGLHRILVEGGAQIHRSFLDAQLVDTLNVYVAGTIVPGGIPWVGGLAADTLSEVPRFGTPEVCPLGEDVLLRYELDHKLPVRIAETDPGEE